LCITTNGEIKRDGNAIMGAGIAKEARDRYKGIDKVLAQKLRSRGNRVSYLTDAPELGACVRVLSFPTKGKWKENSILWLIEDSAKELRAQFLRAAGHYQKRGINPPLVVIPRPGCNNGKLDWSKVKEAIEPILVEKEFLIISK
jgi:hypothetical protein